MTAVRQSISRPGRKTAFNEGDHVVVFDFKTKLSARGVAKKVLGNNTYSVDCGKGPQHVSGDAVSASGVCPDEVDGGQQLTADHGEVQARQDLTQVGQDLSQDSDHDTVADSSSDVDNYIQDWSPDWDRVMAQYIATEPVNWTDIDDVKAAWALRVPLGEDYGNDDLDCEGFY